MISDILDAISNALYDAFDIKNIYFEAVEQGFTKPCFFVCPINEEESPLIGDRAKRTILLDVHYFPKSKDEAKQEMLDVSSKLYSILRRITLLNGDKLNGFELHSEIVDSVLHFFVNYKPIIYYPKSIPDNMGELTKTLEVAHGD